MPNIPSKPVTKEYAEEWARRSAGLPPTIEVNEEELDDPLVADVIIEPVAIEEDVRPPALVEAFIASPTIEEDLSDGVHEILERSAEGTSKHADDLAIECLVAFHHSTKSFTEPPNTNLLLEAQVLATLSAARATREQTVEEAKPPVAYKLNRETNKMELIEIPQ